MKRLITALGMILLLSACGGGGEQDAKDSGAGNGKEQTAVTTDKPLTQDALMGTYVGHLPCESCDAMITSIILNEDNTYAITTRPENDTTFSMPLVDSGRFVMRDSILELTDKGGEIRNYKIQSNMLKQLGPDGNPLDAPGENHYQFVKQ
ncbi:MAG: hypothetical protein BGO31_17265 [Bacteroidetes bacterium 43-16]|nr:MAG: hypothetical protein BGO31_17265 [Bacteroidetes bacterium 43-16]